MKRITFLCRSIRFILVLVLYFVFSAVVTFAADELIPGEEMISGGDFSDALKFSLYRESGGNASLNIVDGEMQIDVSDVGRVAHAVQPFYDGFKLFEGVEYQLDFDARSTLPRSLFIRIQINGSDYHAYFEKEVSLTETMQHYSFIFTMAHPSDPSPRFCINMGYVNAMSDAGLEPADIAPHQVYFDNISMSVRDASGLIEDSDAVRISPIRLNQLGYLPNDIKTAVIADLDVYSFKVVKSSSGATVYEGLLSEPVVDPVSGATVRIADFSAVTRPGAYRIYTSDWTGSPAFSISSQVYSKLLINALRMLYLQRCGSELDAGHAGVFAHPVCHTQTALVYGTDQYIDVSGGWHDAGDYGRYVVPGAKAAADLLLSYTLNDVLLDNVGIPESGDGVDDRLQEARYELDWMLKMQAGSGGVYHKVTGRNFPGFVPPQEETDELVVSPISVTATADFAGVMALASRVFRQNGTPELADAAESYLAAAERAWAFLEDHRSDPGFSNPADVVTGEYPDGKSGDEIFWAAAELARTTGEAEYYAAAAELLRSGSVTAEFGWAEMGGYGLYALLYDPAVDDDSRGLALEIFRAAVRKAVSVIESHPYAVNRTKSFEWGSNMGIANDGVMLLMGVSLLEDESLRDHAARQLDYLLGENATGYCFVTGMGTLRPEHPHHRPSIAFGVVVPGMLVGGPDNALEDPYMQNVLAGCAPAACYADSDQSYSTNEVTIYWNSPLILLISGLTN